MRHPAHYFIKYLLVAQDDLAIASVNGTLALHGLAAVTAGELREISEELGEVPEDFRPWDRADKTSAAWLRKHRIFSLMHPDVHAIEMRDAILAQPRVRRDVETLALGNVSAREASYRLQKLGIAAGELAIFEFQHYFWNTELLGIEDWVEYFARDRDSKTGTGRVSASYDRYNAALLAGPDVALYKAGVKKELDGQKILQEVQRELYHNFLEVKTWPLSEEKVVILSALTRGLAKIDERMQAGDQALHDVLKRFEKFKVLTDNRGPPKLGDLAPTGSVSNKSRDEILMTREN